MMMHDPSYGPGGLLSSRESAMLPLFPKSPWSCEHGDAQLESVSRDASTDQSFWRCLSWVCPAGRHFGVTYHNPSQGIIAP